MSYRTILVDDEPLALTRLERMLAPYRDTIEVIGRSAGGTEAVALINQERPDLLFLDIQMPELTGFDILDRLDYTPLVIFATAHDEYALKAFEVSSIDYLLKPVDPARLRQAINKLLQLSEGAAGDMRERIAGVAAEFSDGIARRIPVRLGDRIRLIPAVEVAFFRASDKYVEVHANGETHLITKSLSQLEGMLPAGEFVRVHRSVIVNVSFIDEFARVSGGGTIVRLKDAARTSLPVSRRYKSRQDLA